MGPDVFKIRPYQIYEKIRWHSIDLRFSLRMMELFSMFVSVFCKLFFAGYHMFITRSLGYIKIKYCVHFRDHIFELSILKPCVRILYELHHTPPHHRDHVCPVTWKSYDAWLRCGPVKSILSNSTHFDLWPLRVTLTFEVQAWILCTTSYYAWLKCGSDRQTHGRTDTLTKRDFRQ